ncbi:MAG: O-antigen ligase family protein, partial [Candidatus Eisenbacteria bacterium]
AVVNFTALATLPLTSDNTIRRAGMVWFVNESGWSIGSPNEAGVALLMLWVVLMALQMQRRRVFGWVMMALTLILLILTQSRSALLAWLIFTVMTWKRLPRRALMLGLLGVLLATPVVATIWWERMVRTVSAERGSFEVYTTLVRVYGWYAAGRMFVDHPLVGVGYLGFRHFSDRYNELGLMLGTCENIFLEVATGMGLLGLLVFLRALWRTLALGDAVARQAPPGSLAGTLARLHKPYIIALAISNLTCDNWVGLVGLAQVAVWCALLVRAGQLSLDAPARA